MNSQKYRQVAGLARGWARGLDPRPIPAALVPRIRAGVGLYFGCCPDGQLNYIGSAARPNDPRGIAKRIRQHPLSRRAKWWSVWVLPFHDDTPGDVVLAIEGQAIELLKPPANRKRHAPKIIPIRKVVKMVTLYETILQNGSCE